MPRENYNNHIVYRDPDTGRFITRARWEQLQEAKAEEYEDWEDLYLEFMELGEEEY